MKSAVITGATSKLGVATVMELVSHGVKIYALVHRGSKSVARLPKSPLVEVVECDLSEMKNYVPCESQRADVFYHFAWGSTNKTVRDDPLPQLENLNYEMDAVFLARRFGCKKFVGAGSQAEYGVVHDIITEETKCDPVTSYGVAKFAAGKLTQKLCRQFDINCIWPRIFSVYGPGEHENTLIAYAIKCAMAGEVAKFSAATNAWDYLYVDDFAKYMYAFGQNPIKSGVYNIASGDSRLLKDFISVLAEVIENKIGKKLCYKLSTEELGENVPNLNCSVEKLHSTVTLDEFVSFEDGIAAVIDCDHL